MSALVMRQALFLHTPKTGGTFVRRAIAEFGIDAHRPRLVPRQHRDHPRLADVRLYKGLLRRRFTFAFVRYPPDWWRSYWAYRMRTGWVPHLDRQVQASDFPTFVEKVLEHAPGGASRLFQAYVGPPGAIDFVGRFEHLVEDLSIALCSAGYELDASRLQRVRPENVSDYRGHPAEYPPDLLRAMLAVERYGVDRWYPEWAGAVAS